MIGDTTRQGRQLEELRNLCRAGAVSRAIDLAFEHFADFGLTDELVAIITGALERTGAPDGLRDRFADLCAAHRR